MGILVKGATPMFEVYDVPASVAFYRDLLGFEIIQTSKPFKFAKEGFGWALLRRDGVSLMLNTAYEDNIRPPAPDATRTAAHADSYLYFDCPNVDAAYLYPRGKGVKVEEPRVAYYGMKQLHVTDPDGYSLVFQWPSDPPTGVTAEHALHVNLRPWL